MKILLVYPEVRENFPNYTGGYNEGVCSIATTLNSLGHKSEIVHITDHYLPDKETFLNKVSGFNPDLVCFSVMSPNYKYARRYNEFIREELGVKTAIGGIHAMFEYENLLRHGEFDFIATGEGEACLPTLAENMDELAAGKMTTPGILVKGAQPVIQHCFVTDLDELPMPDRNLFDFPNLRESIEKQAQFVAGRGCPYQCTYCANKEKWEIIGTKKIRHKSPERLINEISVTLAKYDFIEHIFFQDDILPIDKTWFRRFAELYREKVGKQFSCNIYPMLITEDICELLVSMNCSDVQVGVEAGNERVRNDVMKRRITNGKLKEKIGICEKYGLGVATFNIIGNYSENIDEALDTVKLNAELNTVRNYSTIFIPYPGSTLHKVCVESGAFIDGKEPEYYPGYTDVPVIKSEGITPDQTVFIQRYFKPLTMMYRRLPWKLLDAVVKNPLFPYKLANLFMKLARPILIRIYLGFVVVFKPRFKK